MMLRLSMQFSELDMFAVLPSVAKSNDPLPPSHRARK